jgi:hypothetical protein
MKIIVDCYTPNGANLGFPENSFHISEPWQAAKIVDDVLQDKSGISFVKIYKDFTND